MWTRGIIVAGAAGALLALFSVLGRNRSAPTKAVKKIELARWEGEGGNLPPERPDELQRSTSHPA
jgi:hypothetical protein